MALEEKARITRRMQWVAFGDEREREEDAMEAPIVHESRSSETTVAYATGSSLRFQLLCNRIARGMRWSNEEGTTQDKEKGRRRY